MENKSPCFKNKSDWKK